MAVWTSGSQQFGTLSTLAKAAIEKKAMQTLSQLMNKNFDLRASICTISKSNMDMIRAARSVGASSKFTGSGGAIIGIYENENMFENLKKAMSKIDAEVIKPDILNEL